MRLLILNYIEKCFFNKKYVGSEAIIANNPSLKSNSSEIKNIINEFIIRILNR